MDCDVSPLLCDEFALDPVMLVHVKNVKPSRMEIKHGVTRVCGVRWTLVKLPLKKMPFVKTVRIWGNVVPVFPSALKQLDAFVNSNGRLEGSGKDELIAIDFPAEKKEHEGALID